MIRSIPSQTIPYDTIACFAPCTHVRLDESAHSESGFWLEPMTAHNQRVFSTFSEMKDDRFKLAPIFFPLLR